MKKRFSWGCLLLAVLLLVGSGSLWWLFSRRSSADTKKEAEEEPTAQVQVAPLHRGQIERTLVAYGTAVTAPGGTRSVAFPFEAKVVAVQVNPGQMVAAGDTLLQIEPSVDARLALDTARSAQQAADKALLDTQKRFDAHLATNTDLAAAQSTARDARLKFDSLQSRTPNTDGIVKAPAAGVVTKLLAGPGTVVAPGGPLVEIAVENRFEARLGIASADAAQVKAGQAVHLRPVEARSGEVGKEAALQGVVRVVGASIDPATRLVDVLVTLDDPGAPVLIGTYLRAEIVIEKKEALLAPRAAVLPEAAGGSAANLFTVSKGKAVKHEVETGIDDGENVEITKGADALAESTAVVTEGAYELEDKMPVEVGKTDAKEDKDKESGEEKAP